MNLININKTAIITALQPVLGVVERRNSLPILLNVLIKKEQNKLFFTTSDIELQMTSVLSLSENTVDSNDSIFTVSARKLFDICKSLSTEPKINIALNQDKLIIKQNKTKFSIQTLPAKDFPIIELQKDEIFNLRLETKSFKALIDTVAFSMAIQDVRYYLNGLYLEVKSDSIVAVTTDGHRLSINKIGLQQKGPDKPASLIIPRKAIIELQKNLQTENDEMVNISVTGNFLTIKLADKVMVSKLIDGNYPDFTKVVPESSELHLKFQREELLEKLTRVSILTSDKYRGIRLTLSKELVSLKTINSEQEEANEEIICEQAKGNIDIGFNVSYLIEVLNTLDTDTIVLSLSDSQSSAMITTTKNKNYKYVVMPMRL
jgi:DNA polymerase-3 subunit beta